MDDVDHAQAITERHLEDCLAEHRRRATSQTGNQDGICVDCGEPIPAARLKVQPHAARCIDCQKVFETTIRRTV